jgi:hypothetical protein
MRPEIAHGLAAPQPHGACAPALVAGIRPGRNDRDSSPCSEEGEFLAPFTAKARAGGLLHVNEIKRALEQQVGVTVAASTVYRMLDRHGWRKVVPRPRHPKADMAAQAVFKKTAPPGTPRGRAPG